MQVILTEEEYNQLKLDAAKKSVPDHVTAQNAAMNTIDDFEKCFEEVAKRYGMELNLDPIGIFKKCIQEYKQELTSHFVR